MIRQDGVYFGRNIDNMSDEKNILSLAQNGDEKAFNELINNALVKVKPIIINSFSNLKKEDFEDAFQVACSKAWKKISDFRGDSLFSTWFYYILRNEIYNVIKTSSRIHKHEVSREEILSNLEESSRNSDDFIPLDAIDKCDVTAQTIMQGEEDVSQYRKMLDLVFDKLSPSQQKVIQLIFEEEKSYKEASDELNVPVGTVMSRLFYARKKAQSLIKQYAQRNNIQLPNLGKSA